MPQTTPQLTIRISWLSILNYLGALLTSGWLIYLTYSSSGITYAALAILILGALLRFGASPLFVLSAAMLHFHFDAMGLWLFFLSCLATGAAFFNDLRLYRAQQHSKP